MKEIEQFLHFMQEYAEFLDSMRNAQEEKVAALLAHQLPRIERAIAAQQAMEKRLDTMEQQRESMLAAEGLAGKRLSEVAQLLEPAQATRLDQVAGRIQLAIEDIRYYNDKALELCKLNLQAINGALPQTERSEVRAYTRETAARSAGTSVFEKKI